nr:unnamed protein product [Spirometra erinaceieuropaei]
MFVVGDADVQGDGDEGGCGGVVQSTSVYCRIGPCGARRCLMASMAELGDQKSLKCFLCDKVFLVDNRESCMPIAFEYKAFVDLLESGELSGNIADVQKLRGLIECPIDVEPFKEPLRLCCGHAFCRHCLLRLITPGAASVNGTGDSGNRERSNIICPICRCNTPLSGNCPLADLPRALDIDRLLERLLPAIASSGAATSLVKAVAGPNDALQSIEEVSADMKRRSRYFRLARLPVTTSNGLLGRLRAADTKLLEDGTHWLFVGCTGSDALVHAWLGDIQKNRKPQRQNRSRWARRNGQYMRLRLTYGEGLEVRVQCVKICAGRLFLTALRKALSAPQLEFGVLVACALPSSCPKGQNHQPSDLQILESSPIFERDADCGQHLPTKPIIDGFAVDNEVGELYVTLPANKMICRLSAGGLRQLQKYYLAGSPTDVCVVGSSLWACCPDQKALSILNTHGNDVLQTKRVEHFCPLSICCTTDGRSLVRDDLSRVCWVRMADDCLRFEPLCWETGVTNVLHLNCLHPVNGALIEGLCGGLPRDGGIIGADEGGLWVCVPRC